MNETVKAQPALSRANVLTSAAAVGSLLLIGAAPRKTSKRVPGTNDCPVDKGWPSDYNTSRPPKPPSFTRAECVAAGHALASLVTADRTFAQRYLEVVKLYKRTGGEYARSHYMPLIQEAYRVGDYSNFNAHDFANIHHAAWLVLLQPFSCLTGFNPHEGGSWGDPPKTAAGTCGITDGKRLTHASTKPNDRDYHNIPNATGAYAVHGADITPPAY